ncbi:Imm26 family immunity protein [Shinella sp. M31]|uniref:Imm26 family immunity protein n=1 Tax=Shinella sp. M31 TaxID=3368615 RepID=UPI003BA38E98
MAGKRVRRRIGDILRIDLGGGQHCYAQVSGEPVIVFFDGIFARAISIDDIPMLPVAFRLCVSNYVITKGVWPVVGSRPLTSENAEEPFFYRQDDSGRLFLCHSSFASQNYERPASLMECIGLECAAVWDPEHVIDRLRDHALGQPNRWVESLKIKVPSTSS